MRRLLPSIALIVLLSSCADRNELSFVKKSIESWASKAQWDDSSKSTHLINTSRGWIGVSTKTIVSDGNDMSTEPPNLPKGTFMVWPSLKIVKGTEELTAEVLRCFRDETLAPVEVNKGNL